VGVCATASVAPRTQKPAARARPNARLVLVIGVRPRAGFFKKKA